MLLLAEKLYKLRSILSFSRKLPLEYGDNPANLNFRGLTIRPDPSMGRMRRRIDGRTWWR